MISATPPVAACTNSASDDHGVNDAIASLLSAKSVRERASELLRLAERGELAAYSHDGFWQPMDTLREKMLLERLWASGEAPWKVWE